MLVGTIHNPMSKSLKNDQSSGFTKSQLQIVLFIGTFCRKDLPVGAIYDIASIFNAVKTGDETELDYRLTLDKRLSGKLARWRRSGVNMATLVARKCD